MAIILIIGSTIWFCFWVTESEYQEKRLKYQGTKHIYRDAYPCPACGMTKKENKDSVEFEGKYYFNVSCKGCNMHWVMKAQP